jgi:membrane protein YqaA with SNARE-associated domain
MKDWCSKLNINELSKSNTKLASWILFIFAFADASFLPLPISTIMILIILTNSSKAVRFLIFSVLGTMAGSVAGYTIGHFALLNAQGAPTGFSQLLFSHIPGFSGAAFNKIQILYTKWDFWILFAASFTPIPYSVFTLSSGAFGINTLIFVIATLLSQSLKFFILTYATVKLGEKVKMIFSFRFKPSRVISNLTLATVTLGEKLKIIFNLSLKPYRVISTIFIALTVFVRKGL